MIINMLYRFIFSWIAFFGLLMFCGLLICSCSSSSEKSFKDCPESTPDAIFSAIDVSLMLSHHFEISGFRSIEEILLISDVHLELLQTGCSPMIQQFTIQFPIDHEISEHKHDLATFTSEAFAWIGSLSPSLQGLSAWSLVFRELAYELRSGESFDVEDIYEAKADLIISDSQLLLLVELKML